MIRPPEGFSIDSEVEQVNYNALRQKNQDMLKCVYITADVNVFFNLIFPVSVYSFIIFLLTFCKQFFEVGG